MATDNTKPLQDFKTIRWTVDEGIGLLLMNQPPSNTMTLRFFAEFSKWTDLVAQDTGLKAVIIHGNGRHFSSGADLNELLVNLDEQLMVDNYRNFLKLERMGIPVISAIRGVCLGSALELALFSHFRICSGDAILGLPETTFNLMPGIGGIQRFATLAGKPKALEMILRGMTFSAADALQMGLVDAVVAKSEVLPVALKFARTLPWKMLDGCRTVYLKKFLNTSDVTE
jgi:enoyl-CoA hydratase/carnithine racemase